MRKDVKIGLTIGGVLLAVLIVYLLVPKNTDSGQYAGGPGSTNSVDERQEGTGSGYGSTAGSAGSTATSTPSTPTSPPQETTAGPTQPPAANPQTPAAPEQGSTPDAVPAPGDVASGTTAKTVDWERILMTGQIPAVPLAATPGDNGTNRPAPSDPFAPEVNYGSTVKPMPPGSSPGGPAATRSEPTVAPPKAGPREHVVQQGELLTTISLQAYGDARHYREILKANPGVDERKLRPGTKLILPDASTFSAPKAQLAGARQEPAIDPTKEYRVQPGDSLHKIAVKLYGKAGRADDLYEANKDKIGDDSSRLKVGTVLKLPDAPTAASAQSSR